MESFLLNRHNILIGFLIAIVITVGIFPFINLGGKYKVTELKDLKQGSNYINIWKDLYHDGTSERIFIIKNFEGNSAILLYKSGRNLFEWNLHGKILMNDFLFAGDYNGDGTDELYAFSYNHDSIFLSGYDIKANEVCFPPLFLAKFKYFNHRCDISAHCPRFHDFGHNGIKKLVVDLHAGFSKTLRKVFIIDLKNRTFISSPKAGTDISGEMNFVDLNGNGNDEITGDFFAAGNDALNYPCSDRFLWFLVYDSNLHYLFQPIKLGHHPGSVHVYPFKTKSQNLLAVYTNSNLLTDSTFIGIADAKGHFLCHRTIPYNKKGKGYYLKVFPIGSKYRLALYHVGNGLVEYLNKNLQTVETYHSALFSGRFYSFDLDGDGKKEEVYFGKDIDHLVVSRYDFTDPVVLKFSGEYGDSYFSERWEDGKPVALCLSLPHRYYEFSYGKNPLYFFRFLIYGGVFIFIFLLVNLIGFYYQRFLKIQFNAEKRIQENQLRAIEMQLNPHFILNTLNSIGALYEKKETQAARIYMGKYSKMMRNTLLAAGKIAIPLKEELDFVKNYLDLEQFRNDNQFTYSVSCDLKPGSIQIPRLLVYTFVENAVKHGIFPILGKQPAHIVINCSDKKSFWVVEISDDGIGREASGSKEVHSTGKGLEILNETLSLYRMVYRQRITYNVSDLNPGTGFPGTKILIFIEKMSPKTKRRRNRNSEPE